MSKTIKTTRFKTIAKKPAPWIHVRKNLITMGVEINRNISGYVFPHKQSLYDSQKVANVIEESIESNIPRKYKKLLVDTKDDIEMGVIIERRHLDDIDVLKSNRKVLNLYISNNETESILVNNNNHIQVNVYENTEDIEHCFDRAENIVESLNLDYAHSSSFGYLTSEPYMMGFGTRIYAIVHIPFLSVYLTGDERYKILSSFLFPHNIVPCGLYGNDDIIENFVYIDAIASHGKNEHQTILSMFRGISNMLDMEEAMKLNVDFQLMHNQILESFGKKTFCNFIGELEGLKILSDIKTGMDCGIIEEDYEKWEEVFSKSLSNHLKYNSGDNESLHVNRMRANLFNNSEFTLI